MPLEPGQSLGHYRIVRLIGQGGMGEVYLAEDTKLDRRVALKVLPPEMASSADRLVRFRREAKAVAALNHPHIVTIYSVEMQDGMHFLTMELVEGMSLDHGIPNGGLPLAKVFEVGIALADALATAHEKGIVHRDLKPSNVMVTRDGRVKVLDFGLAKLAAEPVPGASPPGAALSEMATRDRSLTGTGVVTGTVPYMSPEQAQSRQVDARTDVFSLGVVLYEMTTGTRPFGGGSPAETMSAILRDAPRPVTEARADAPRHLARIIDHCLEKEPDARFQTAKDIRNELRALREEIGSGEAAPVGPPGSAVASGSKAGAVLARRGRWIAPGAGVALIAVVVTVWIGRGARWPRGDIARPDPGTGALKKASAAPAVVAEASSIAVLPFENLSGDPEQKYFADGMTEALITELSRFSALRVVSRTSMMRYQDTRVPLPEIGRELQVDVVVEGSVLKAEGRVRVTAQLIDARADRHLWAENYDRELRDILTLHSEVARAIAREVQVAMTPAEVSRLAEARPIDPAAYEAYLRGRYHFNRTSEAELVKAVGYFERALEKEPRYAAAYSGLADCYNRLGMTLVGRPPGEMRSKAIAAASEALRMDDRLAEAHVSLGWAKFFNWDWAGAEESFLRAMALNPNYAEAHQMYSLYLAALGRFDQAIATARRAVELDPLSVNSQARLGQVLFYARRYEDAIRELRNALELDPNFVLALFHLGDTYAKVLRYDEAISVLERAATLSRRNPVVLGYLGCAYAKAGRDLEARKLLKELTELSGTRYIPPIPLAWLDACLKDRKSAFESLEKAFAERSYLMVYLAVDPSIDSLRDDSRFRDLLRRMSFPGDARLPS